MLHSNDDVEMVDMQDDEEDEEEVGAVLDPDEGMLSMIRHNGHDSHA